jgi:hypothetical protein
MREEQAMLRVVDIAPKIWFELLVGLVLCTTGAKRLLELNPVLTDADVHKALASTTVAMVMANRVGR